ncbi:hypothetical protein GCM10028807_23570 [Spirosoma daeguense]
MSTLFEILSLLTKSVILIARSRSAIMITLLIALIIAGLSWYLCNNYVKLWNRRFRLTTTHQVLTLIASVLTFFFVLAFSGLKYIKEVATTIVSVWESYEIKADEQWGNAAFREAYYKIKELKAENFDNHPAPEEGGHLIPVTKKVSQELAAKLYASAACAHFDKVHPFLSKIIWSNPAKSADNISSDVANYFSNNPGSNYSAGKAIDIAAGTIKTQLSTQTPRTVIISRIVLVVLYLLVMAIPLGAIGYAAYKDIRIRK